MRLRFRFAIGCVVFAWLCVASALAQTTSYQGIWWAAPAGSESGWGINFTHQGDVVFATWFTYDDTGRPLWLVATLVQAGAGSFAGDLYRTTGPALGATPFDPGKVTGSAVGKASVAFRDPGTATFTYALGGVARTKTITPQAFRTLPSCQLSTQANLTTAGNYQGLWWAAPAGSESGWGINFAHQGDVIFATWFTYDTDNQPLWLVASFASQPDNSFVGDLYRTTGPASSAVPFNPASVHATKVGTAALRFANGNAGTFTYTVDGVTQTKDITQQVFRDQVTVCEPSTMYSVPTDITRVTYPDSYITPLPERSNPQNDACDLDLPVVAYPQSWIGQHPLPQVKGAPLKASYIRGMDLKDLMLPNNPAFVLHGAPGAPNGGCTGSLQAEFLKTIARLKALGVDYITPPQWHWLSKRTDGTWYVKSAEASDLSSLSDVNLTFLVNAAHAAGIKVLIRNQIPGMVDFAGGPAYSPDRTYANLQNWFVAYQPYMIERAKFFQSIGVDAFAVDCDTCWLGPLETGTGTQTGDFIHQQYAQTVANIRSIFSGKLLMGYLDWLDSAPGVVDKIDILGLSYWGPERPATADQAANLSVESYKHLTAWHESYVKQIDKLNKTILVQFSAQSRANFPTLPDYLEEAVCVSSFGSLNPSDQCIQLQTQPDFSVQAIAYEAMLELIGQVSLNSNVMVFPSNYWETDSITPRTAFPNLAASIRNKPAEGIVKAWYARP